MPRFLDLNTSENAVAPFAAPVAIPVGPLVAASFAGNPGQFGGIGLSTQFVAGPTVDLAGTIAVSSGGVASTTNVVINIVRNPSSVAAAIIYTLSATLAGTVTFTDLSFNAQDLAAPAGQLTAYAAYVTQVSTSGAATGVASRLGPESFWGLAADRTTG